MRSYDEYRRILELWAAGESKKGIARITGINRATVRDCINRYGSVDGLTAAYRDKALKGQADANSIVPWLESRAAPVHQAYIYLLGLYLGDGTLSRSHHVHKLRVFLDKKYPGIIDACLNSIQVLLPDHKVGIVNKQGCVEVYCYYKHWPVLFPQHGPGMKHTRAIALEAWQQRLADAYPLDLWRGLYHSDGSRSRNVVKGKNYPRYLFANESPGVRRIFCRASDQLGLRWTLANRRNVCISRRGDVITLDRVVGPKT